MAKLSSRILSILVLFVFIPLWTAHAQEAGTITGVVVDTEQGETLVGANVSLAGTARGAATDLNGRYRIENVEPGAYDIRFSFLGFQSKVVEGVTVAGGETVRLDIELLPDSGQFEELIVSAEAARNSEVGLLKQRQKAASVSDAISAEMIRRSAAGNAAEAMNKVTGASVIDGKYVNVRGLQGRYVNAELDGSTLPSTDPDGNSVALDLFPSNLIDNIATTKSFTPDRGGDFTGGSIDISTKAIPDDRFFSVSVSSAFNSEVGIGGAILRPSQGLRDIPASANNGVLPQNLAEAFNDDAAAGKLDDLARAFATPIVPVEDATGGDNSAELAFGNRFTVLGGRTLGFIGSLSYKQSHSGYFNGTTSRFRQVGIGSETLTPTAQLTTQRGLREILFGGLGGLSLQLTPNHQISARILYNSNRESEARFESGALPRDLSGEQVFQTRAMRTTDRTVQSGELKGYHHFGRGRGVRIEWSTAISETSRDEPDYRFFANQYSTSNSGADTTFGISRSIYLAPTRYFRDLSDENLSGKFSIQAPIGNALLKSGGQVQYRSRAFRERRFEHLNDQSLYSGDPNSYINGQAGFLEQDERGRNRFGTYVLDRTQPSNNYDGTQNILAGFIMAEVPLPWIPSVEFIGGVRVEHTDMAIETIDGGHTGQFQETDILPSSNFVWSINDDMNLRTAYGRTVARPSFREFAPFNSFNFIGDYIEIGNPELTRTLADNLDLRWEWFFGGSELISAGVFYKSLNDPIERTIDTRAAGSDVVIRYVNKDFARVYGAEFEGRTRLGRVASWLEYVSMGANVTITSSQVERSDEEMEAIRAFDENPSPSRPLQGQSPYLVNLNMGYENPVVGTSVNLFVNYFGDRLDTVTRNGLDLFEEGRTTVDVTASQRLLSGLSVRASVKNALNTNFIIAQSFRGESFVNDKHPLGRSLSVGISYEF